jgi:hypothetical protein
MDFFKKQKKEGPGRRRDAANIRSEQQLQDIDQRYNFRRNRTLTGSSSSQVVSVSEGNAQIKSPRVHAHELIKKRRHMGLLLAVALISAAGLYGLIYQFSAGVIIKTPGITAALDKSYEDTIQEYFGSRPVERLRFLTNETALSDFVKERLPEVASVRMGDNAGLGKSSVSIMMRQPLVGWAIQGKQQFVDASGTAFVKNYYPAPSVQIVDNSGIRPESGQAVASNRFLGFVGRTVGLAKAQGYKVTQVIIPAATTRQVELHIDGVPYLIKLSVDRAVGEQIEDMARTIVWLKQVNAVPQYIDVRVSGKAYYH